MSVFHPSWSSYFAAFGATNAVNTNTALFGDAMDAQKSKIKKINNLIKDKDTITLVKGKDGKLKALNNFKKIGGTRIRPEMQLSCLVGSGPRAIGIVVDSDKITKSKKIKVPTAEAIWGYSTINELENVENCNPISTPAATIHRSDCRGGNATAENTTATTNNIYIDDTLTYTETMCFIPPPFIVKQIFTGIPNNPIELILVTKAAAIDFNNTHSSAVGLKNVDATVQAKRVALWAFTVYKDHTEEASFVIDPDNEEIQKASRQKAREMHHAFPRHSFFRSS